jgi:hypothetical protein
VHQISKRIPNAPHLWTVFFTILALAAIYPVAGFAASRSAADAPSTLVPTFAPPAGYYDRDIQLKIIPPNPDGDRQAKVIFTIDGSVPTNANGTVYTRPLLLRTETPAVTVIRARAVLRDGDLGPVVSASFFVGVQATLPMMSLIIDPDDIFSPERGIYINALERGDDWERPVDVTYVDKERHLGFQVPAGLRMHGGWSRYFDKKSLRIYFRREYGVSRLEYPLFADNEDVSSTVQSFKRLVLHNGGEDTSVARDSWNWTLMRNQLVERLALQLNGHTTHSQPALLFINGEPWGIYQIRERIDRHFLTDHYGVESADLLDSPAYTWERNDLKEAMGDREHWDHLLQFVETHDLADPANYAYVESQVDVANFIDYNLLQIYSANTDWPRKNVLQFRPHVQGGRWQWIFWDSDFCCGATLYSRLNEDLIGSLLEGEHPSTGGHDVLLFRRLLENRVFFDQFLSRAADLLNAVLAPQPVIAQIDAMAAELNPDMIYETTRWSSASKWEANVEELRDFALGRPSFVRRHMVERFGLGGTADLTINPSVRDAGTVAINGTLIQKPPWHGTYFQDIPVKITAVPKPGFRFAGWDPPDLPQEPTITLLLDPAQTITPRFEPVSDDVPRSGDVIFSTSPLGANGVVDDGRFELLVVRPGGVDLRGWRVTDNDTKTATDEGSLSFTDNRAFARVPQGTRILIVPIESDTAPPPDDDLNAWDRQMVIHVGNDNLDIKTDPGFALGPIDNLALLAPGPTGAFEDDQGIAFVANGSSVNPASFGVLGDGVLPTQ